MPIADFDIEGELSGRQFILALRRQNKIIQSVRDNQAMKSQEINNTKE